MKILFTICGRAGSKGIKNKNIREFVGNRYRIILFPQLIFFKGDVIGYRG